MVKHLYQQKCCWSAYCLRASPMHFYLPEEDIPIYFLTNLQSGLLLHRQQHGDET